MLQNEMIRKSMIPLTEFCLVLVCLYLRNVDMLYIVYLYLLSFLKFCFSFVLSSINHCGWWRLCLKNYKNCTLKGMMANEGKRGIGAYKSGVYNDNSFWLVVNITFQTEENAILFEKEFAKLALFVESNEPETLSYKLAKSDKRPFSYIVFERYSDKEKAYLTIHKSSEEFKSFKSKLLELEPTINGESYSQVDPFGFI